MKNFVLIVCSVLGFTSPTLAIEGEAGTGPNLEACLADCEKNQSVTSSEYSKCKAKCDVGNYAAAPIPATTEIVAPVVNEKKPVAKKTTAPSVPPAVTSVAEAKKKADTPAKSTTVVSSSVAPAA